MFTIKRGKTEYYSEDGGFVTLSKYQIIQWFPLYLTASQLMMKLTEDNLSVVSSLDLLKDVIESLDGLVPELVEIASGFPKEELLDLAHLQEVATLKGGLIEHKQTIQQLTAKIEILERERAYLASEAEKLGIVFEEYQKLLKL